MGISVAAWKQYISSIMVGGLVLVAGCNAEDKRNAKNQLPTTFYLDYKVSADEGEENVIVLLQFREKGPEGEAVVLSNNSQVLFDGEALTADSAQMAGVYYEVQRPLADFAGRHEIVYTDPNGKLYKEEFEFNLLRLEGLTSTIAREDISLNLGNNLKSGKVQVIVTDTSFTTEDINEEYPVNEGQLHIGKEALQKVSNGPILLELNREEVKKLANGRLLISYTIKRDLELKDR